MGYAPTPKAYTFEETCKRLEDAHQKRLDALHPELREALCKQVKAEWAAAENAEDQLAELFCRCIQTAKHIGINLLEIVSKHLDQNEPKH